jgi:hypothetical protein
MDPTENLQHQRRIVEQIRACEDRGHKPQWCACSVDGFDFAPVNDE